MTREELIRLLAEVIAGLQVPVSMGVPLGAADAPARRVMQASGFGWKDADAVEVYLRRELDGCGI